MLTLYATLCLDKLPTATMKNFFKILKKCLKLFIKDQIYGWTLDHILDIISVEWNPGRLNERNDVEVGGLSSVYNTIDM